MRSPTDSSILDPEVYLEFPHDYELEIPSEMPLTSKPIIHFPANSISGQDGMLISFSPSAGEQWTGLFAREFAGTYMSGIYASPDKDVVCVVSNGRGYLVKVSMPTIYDELPLHPVKTVKAVPRDGLLLLASFTDIFLINADGRRLFSQVSYDGIQMLEVTGKSISGRAWSPSDGDHIFRLDISTGTLITVEQCF